MRVIIVDDEPLARAVLREHLGAIARVEPMGKDGHCAVLKSGARVPISRSGYQKVRDLLR
jgi:DNA-binding LytR/AlgR family response regulator